MKPTIQRKLLFSHLIVILVMSGVLAGYLLTRLDSYLQTSARDGLMNETRLARLMAEREISKIDLDAEASAAAIGREIKARATIMTADGRVAGDSGVNPTELKTLENHIGRPEVKDALQSGTGSAVRYSATLHTDMLYTAATFRTASGEQGIVRLALPLSGLTETRATLHKVLWGTIAVAALLAVILSTLLSSVASRSLRNMAQVATRIGEGDYSQRLPLRGNDELAELGRIMNEMAARTDAQMTGLAEQRNRLTAILQGMGEGVMVTDGAGIITHVNPAFIDQFSVTGECEGRPFIELIRQPDLVELIRESLLTGEERHAELVLRLPVERQIVAHLVPPTGDPALRGVVAVFHDVSDLNRLERIRKDFVTNVSHELRTPLSVIKGYSETLLDGSTEDDPLETRRFVEVIHRHADRLSGLVADLLALAEMEARGREPVLTPTALNDAVNHAYALLERKVTDKGITYNSIGFENAPQVMADRSKLEQVLLNLLDNAVKYTPENGSIAINAELQGAYVEIAVSDTGIGIPEKDLPRIFERFYRVDAARSRELGGTGLGLSIVKHIIQLHGGKIDVTSQPGKGTTFRFTLKACIPDNNE